MLAHPHGPAVLGASVARVLADGLGEERAARVPAEALHDVAVAEDLVRLAGLDVPELDGEVARGGGEDVLGGGVEVDLSDLSAVR